MKVDLLCPITVQGTLPDHPSHALLGALGRRLGDIHRADWLGVGHLDRRGVGPLLLRVEGEHLAHVLVNLRLATLEIGAAYVELGEPVVRPIMPAGRLESRLVVIKGYVDPEPFTEACIRQLHHIDAHGEIELGRRRIVRIGGVDVVGYAVHLTVNDDAASVRVQSEGIGGRRRFGCGLFLPVGAGLPHLRA